ncbi:MAG: glycosyltransferase family 39 protein [Nanoarchaeota archaeon]
MSINRKTSAIFIIIIVAGIFLRTYDLGWETYSYSEVEMKQAVDEYAKGNFINNYYIFDTPPLPKYIFAAAVILSNTETSLRMVSVIFGMLTVIALFFFTKKLYDVKTALLASAILSFSVVHVQLSRYVQQETMLSFFYVMIAYFLWEAVNENNKYSFVFLGIFIGLAMETKFISIIMIVVILVYTIYSKHIKFSLKPKFSVQISNWILKSFLLALLVFFVLWPFGFTKLHTDATIAVNYGNEVRSQEISTDLPIMLLSFGRRIFTSMPADMPYPLILKIPVLNYPLLYLVKECIIFIPLLIFGIYCILRRPIKQDKFIIILIATFIILLSFHQTNINYRHVVGIIPFFAILASRWVSYAKIKLHYILMIFAIVILFSYTFIIGPSYALYYNPLKDTLGLIDTDAKMSEGMKETINYIKQNCTSFYAGPYYRFMMSPYAMNFSNTTASCVISGDINELFELGNVRKYIQDKQCVLEKTVYKNSIKILDIYRC